MNIEQPARPATGLSQALSDLGGEYAINAVVAFIFAASGPVAIILSVGTRGGLSESDLSSWIFGSFFINGLISIAFCWLYRQPLVFFWTIPGTVLVGPALDHLSFPEVIGAFLATGLLMFVLGLSGWVRRCMEAVPMPIVMGMVAGVFLRFGLDLVFALRDDFWIAAPMTAAFLVLSAWHRLGKLMPPLIGALIVGAVAIAILGTFNPAAGSALGLVQPNSLHAGILVARHGGTRGAARDHGAGGAERTGLRGAQGRGSPAPHQCHHRGVRRGVDRGGLVSEPFPPA